MRAPSRIEERGAAWGYTACSKASTPRSHTEEGRWNAPLREGFLARPLASSEVLKGMETVRKVEALNGTPPSKKARALVQRSWKGSADLRRFCG